MATASKLSPLPVGWTGVTPVQFTQVDADAAPAPAATVPAATISATESTSKRIGRCTFITNTPSAGVITPDRRAGPTARPPACHTSPGYRRPARAAIREIH